MAAPASRILLLGATGTIGRATARELVRRGHEVVAFVRPRAEVPADGASEPVRHPEGHPAGMAHASPEPADLDLPDAVEVRVGDVLDPASVGADAFRGESFDAVLSCMASRTGVPEDAWAVEHDAHLNALRAAEAAGVAHFVLLSAICVQKPELEFQRAKLAFEEALRASTLRWSIVRATAFFKSLVGQVARVQAGKPFLMFGDGTGTACRPIGDTDLAVFLADCLDDPARWNRILPIGGPGPALTPRDQGRLIFEATGMPQKYRRLPVALLDAVVGVLSVAGTVAPPLRKKAELARIGRYYATESMLVWDAEAQRYDAEATPSFGTETLAEFYRKVVAGELRDERGDHAVL